MLANALADVGDGLVVVSRPGGCASFLFVHQFLELITKLVELALGERLDVVGNGSLHSLAGDDGAIDAVQELASDDDFDGLAQTPASGIDVARVRDGLLALEGQGCDGEEKELVRLHNVLLMKETGAGEACPTSAL